MQLDDCPPVYRAEAHRVHAVQEVCRSVLNSDSFRFVVANAPADVVSSFRTQQQRLARLSLQVTSAMLVHRLGHRVDSFSSLSRSVRTFMSGLRNAFLLGVCTVGRVALGLLKGVSIGIPQRVQIFVSAQILTKVGDLLIDAEQDAKLIAGNLSVESLPSNTLTRMFDDEDSHSAVVDDILRALAASLPNDLSQLIFLATLRDNNSGHYYHPEVARRFSVEVADQSMLVCHRRIYQRVVALPLEDLTDQLDAYTATVRAPKERLIERWTKLRAYRATIPMDTDPISAEIFFMKVGVAVAILEARLPDRILRSERK